MVFIHEPGLTRISTKLAVFTYHHTYLPETEKGYTRYVLISPLSLQTKTMFISGLLHNFGHEYSPLLRICQYTDVQVIVLYLERFVIIQNYIWQV